MRKVVFVVLAAAACAALPAQGEGEDEGEGEADKDKILRRFVEEFVPLAADKAKPAFQMGSPKGGPASEQPAHPVTFSYSFQIAKYEVTQELYEAIMVANPSRWKGPRNSVEMIDWNEANDFSKRVTVELRKRKLLGEGDGEVIRLPTEAEWEYACRAGTQTAFSFGDDAKQLGDFGWFTGNAKGNDPPVGAKKANPWGLYDMHGYVWEWCLDRWAANYDKAPADGSPAKADTKERVVRGGAWTSKAEECRSAHRAGAEVSTRGPDIGFRCVRTNKMYD